MTFRTPATKTAADATFYAFAFDLEWKGAKKVVTIIGTDKDDASAYFYANARAISGLPKTSVAYVRFIGKETPEDREARAEMDGATAFLVAVARGER